MNQGTGATDDRKNVRTTGRRSVLRKASAIGSLSLLTGSAGCLSGANLTDGSGNNNSSDTKQSPETEEEPADVSVPEPAVHYTFEGGDRETVIDEVGDSNGTNYGATYTNSAAVGSQALELDGNKNYVSVGTTEAVRHTIPMTLSAWVNPAELDSRGRIIHKQQSGDNGLGMLLRVNPGGVIDARTGPQDPDYFIILQSRTEISAGEWTHIAWTRSSDGGAIFINGEMDVRNGRDVDPVQTEAPFQIGGRDTGYRTGEFFDGALDDIRYYHQALSPAQIEALAEMGP